MIFQGKSLSAQLLDDGIVELKFDAQGSVNKFDQGILILHADRRGSIRFVIDFGVEKIKAKKT